MDVYASCLFTFMMSREPLPRVADAVICFWDDLYVKEFIPFVFLKSKYVKATTEILYF